MSTWRMYCRLGKISYTAVYCTQFTLGNNCIYNSYCSFIQRRKHQGNMPLLYFTVMCFFLFKIWHLVSPLNCFQIVKFYVLIHVWEDKTEVSQNSLQKLKSGEQVSVISYYSLESAFFLLLRFFNKASSISLRARQWLKSQWKDGSYFRIF